MVSRGDFVVFFFSFFFVVIEGRFILSYSLEDKLVFFVGIDRMIYVVWYIIKVCEFKMSKLGC